jgi:uncharacterized protein
MQPFKSITYTATRAGVKLLVIGAVHGSEKCGTLAINRMKGDLDSGAVQLVSGSVTFVPITNPKAYVQNTRNGDRNLNRRLRPTTTPKEFEDHVANWLCPLMAQHDVLLDLHSFQAQGKAFVMMGPENNSDALEPTKHAASELALAQRLGVTRAVDGWLSTYAKGVARRKAFAAAHPEHAKNVDHDAQYGIGTTEFMRSSGGYSLTLECGQHADPHAPEVGYQAIRNALGYLGIAPAIADPQPHSLEGLHLYEVIDKIDKDDAFAKPWQSFDPIVKGELIGTRVSGAQFHAPTDGFIVFPNAMAEAGAEWFYLAQSTQRFTYGNAD